MRYQAISGDYRGISSCILAIPDACINLPERLIKTSRAGQRVADPLAVYSQVVEDVGG
jgi:hypothetical protein